MADQVLELAGLAVVGLPRFQFVVMAQEQLGQILGILAVVLGATGDEGLAEFLEADGVDGIESDPGVGFQKDDQVGRRLFQADGDTVLGMILTHSCQPIVKRLGRSCHRQFLSVAGAGVDEMQIGLSIGTVQADDQVIGMICGHGVLGLRFAVGGFPADLTRRRQYRRVVLS